MEKPANSADRPIVVRDIASPLYPTVSADETIVAAAGKFAAANVAALPVVDSDRNLKGILTQANVLAIVARGEDLAAIRCGDVAHEVAGVDPGLIIERPGQARVAGVPIAPVVQDGKLLGVVTPDEVRAEMELRNIYGERAAELITEISPEDGMHAGLRGLYLRQGARGLACIRRAMERSGKNDPRTVLDLPCGHGRVLRHLKLAFPDAELTACDVDRGAVDFCASVLGARPVYSETDLRELRIDGVFDLIWVGSLLTHLDREPWGVLVSFCVEHLGPTGLLVFTTVGENNAIELLTQGIRDHQLGRMLANYRNGGFSYQEYEGQSGWGLTMCSPEFVRGELERHPSLEFVSLAQHAWGPQDVYAYRNNERLRSPRSGRRRLT
jgi:SAM-dependent methyltransferase